QKFVLSPDARNMAWVTSSPAVHIMHVDPADMEEVVTCHPIATGRVVGLSFSGDGQVLATLTENATHIQVWDCSTGKQICDIPCHPLLTPEWGMNKMQLSPDGQACLCDVGHQESVLWDL